MPDLDDLNPPQPIIPPIQLERMDGVELFASGVYRDKTYDADSIEEIAANVRKLGPKGLKLLEPPTLIGHEENQEYLDRTDLPAAGWVDCDSVKVRRYNDPENGPQAVLIGDIYDVPSPIATKIRAGLFKKISAEIYPDFQDDHGKSYGRALRRVVILGGEVPMVKRLANLPNPSLQQFSERKAWTQLKPLGGYATKNSYVCFAERGMGREDMKAKIRELMPSILMPTLNSMSDDQLADLIKNIPQPSPKTAGKSLGDSVMSREEMIAELTAMGEDPTALQGLDDMALQAMYDEKTAGTGAADAGMGGMGVEGATPSAFAEGDPTPEEMISQLTEMGEDPDTLAAMSDEELAAHYQEIMGGEASEPTPEVAGMPQTFSERSARLSRTNYMLQRRIMRTTQRQAAERFCEKLVNQGRLLPAQKPLIVNLLMGKTMEIHTFSEKGRRVRRSPFDHMAKQLEKWPIVIHFSERIKQQKRTAGGNDGETQIVERFSESAADSIVKFGNTPQKYVADFVAMKKKNPALTAKDYGVPDEFIANS